MSRVLYIARPKGAKYGLLYNWLAAIYSTGGASIAPAGWHVPSKAEFETLRDGIGGWSVAGGHLKDNGYTYWLTPNTGADNSVSFNGRGASIRNYSTGIFANINTTMHCWSATEDADILKGYGIDIHYDTSVFGSGGVNKKQGSSIRLIKNDSTDLGTMTDYDGNVYPTVTIGSQVWMAQNLMVTHFNDGTVIPWYGADADDFYTDSEWVALTSPACCSWNNIPANVKAGFTFPT